MEIKFTQTLTLDKFMEFQKKYIFKSINLFRRLLYLFVFLLGLVLIIINFIINEYDSFLDNFFPGILFMLFPFFVIFVIYSNAKKQYNLKRYLFINAEYSFTNDKMIIVLSNMNKYEIFLNTFLSIDETENVYLLFTEKAAAYIIDKQQIPNEFKAELASILTKAKLKINITDHLV